MPTDQALGGAGVAAVLDSVNLGGARPNPHKPVRSTGIDKRPVGTAVEVRDPGPTATAGDELRELATRAVTPS